MKMSTNYKCFLIYCKFYKMYLQKQGKWDIIFTIKYMPHKAADWRNVMFGIIANAAAAAPAQAGAASGMSGILMIVIMFAVMYFILIRPQKKKEKQTKEMIAALGVGDVVTTIGGIMGKITKVKDDEIILVTGMVGNPNERSTMRFAKWAIRDVVKKAENAKVIDEPVEAEETDSAAEEN